MATNLKVLTRLSVFVCIASAALVFGEGENVFTADGPSAFSVPDNSPQTIGETMDARAEWDLESSTILPAGELLFDNGLPLDDFGHPASQLSSAAPPWSFIAAAADDFYIPIVQPDELTAKIKMVRVAFHFFGIGGNGATPMTTWTGGVSVAIYNNLPSNVPSGQPNSSGGQVGDVVAAQLIPMSTLSNQVLVNSCRSCYLVDIPVDITIQRNIRYWLSVVPRFNGPPQSAWVLSQNQNANTLISRTGFPNVGNPFWTQNPGNLQSCIGSPPAGSRTDMAFQLYGDVKVGSIQVVPVSND